MSLVHSVLYECYFVNDDEEIFVYIQSDLWNIQNVLFSRFSTFLAEFMWQPLIPVRGLCVWFYEEQGLHLLYLLGFVPKLFLKLWVAATPCNNDRTIYQTYKNNMLTLKSHNWWTEDLTAHPILLMEMIRC